jgi:hypothetical protein
MFHDYNVRAVDRIERLDSFLVLRSVIFSHQNDQKAISSLNSHWISLKFALHTSQYVLKSSHGQNILFQRSSIVTEFLLLPSVGVSLGCTWMRPISYSNFNFSYGRTWLVPIDIAGEMPIESQKSDPRSLSVRRKHPIA